MGRRQLLIVNNTNVAYNNTNNTIINTIIIKYNTINTIIQM